MKWTKCFALALGMSWTASNTVACSRGRTGNPTDTRPVAFGALAIRSSPTVDIGIGGVDDRRGFGRVAAATRLSNGDFVILDSRSNTIHAYSRAGHPVWSFGRTGGGADGFRAASWLGRCHGDSLFTWDPLEGRVVVVGPNGAFGRQFRQPSNTAAMRCTPAGVIAVLTAPPPNGKPPQSGESPRRVGTVYLANALGDTTASVGPVSFAENRPMGRATFVATAGRRLYVGTADSGSVDAYTLDGQHEAAIRVTGDRLRSPTRREYRAAIAQLVAGLRYEKDRDAAARYLRRIPMPSVAPPYSGVFTAPDGTVWVDTSEPGDTHTVLRAVSSTGQPVGELHLPLDLRVLEVGDDYIVGAHRTARGEERVIAYRYSHQQLRTAATLPRPMPRIAGR